MAKCVTKNWPKAFLLCLFIAILSSSFYGCGGTFRSFPGEGDVSGSWNLFLTPSGGSALAPILCTLTQTDNNISGTKSDGATITGTIGGKDIALTLHNADGSTTTLAGTAGGDWKTMSGTYTSTGSDGSGNWSATKNVPTPTPAPLAVTPTSVTLSCSGTTGAPSQIFTVTGGTLSKYSVTASSTTLVTLSTTTLTTNGQFTVTAITCPATGTIVTFTVTDTVSTPVTVPVTISNP